MRKALLLVIAFALSAQHVRADEVFIRGVLMIDGSGGAPRANVDIAIGDGRIRAIAPTGSMEARGRLIDAAGMTALPGLIDSHVHFVAASGSSYRHDSDETIRELNRQHLRAYVACGVTTVLDAGAFTEVARDIESWLAAGNPGPRYLTTGPYVRPPDGYGHPRFGAEATPAEVETKLDVIQSLGGVGVKIALEEGFGPFGGPRQFPPEILSAVTQGARRRGLPLSVHARTESTQRAALDIGAHAIMHAALDVGAPKDLSDQFIERFGSSGAYQVTTLSLTDTFPGLFDTSRLDDPLVRLVVPDIELATARSPDATRHFYVNVIGWAAPWTWEFTRPWIASFALSRDRLLNAVRIGQRNLLREHRASVPIVVGTDAPSPWPDAIYHFHGPQVARELELVGEAGLSPLETIAAATSTPATMLGLDSEIGTLAVGKRADLVLVAGDASRDLRALRNVRWTIRDGVAHTPEEWMGNELPQQPPHEQPSGKESVVPPQALFGISIALGFLAWGIVAARYLWPALHKQPRADALRPILLLHSFRFIGLAFLVPGVVSPDLPDAFARPAAYGDLIAAALALLALAGLRSRLGIGLVWVFNLWGSADLLYAYYQGRVGVGVEPGQLGAAYFIPTVVVPLLLITHGLVFRLLLQGDGIAAPRDRQRAA